MAIFAIFRLLKSIILKVTAHWEKMKSFSKSSQKNDLDSFVINLSDFFSQTSLIESLRLINIKQAPSSLLEYMGDVLRCSTIVFSQLQNVLEIMRADLFLMVCHYLCAESFRYASATDLTSCLDIGDISELRIIIHRENWLNISPIL